MPELPEVETIVRDLTRSVPGKTIATVEVFRADLIDGEAADAFAAGLRRRRIRSVTRRAKNIVFDLGAERLLVNLGMTGRLLLADADAEPPLYLGVRIALGSAQDLLYTDARRFGRLWRTSAAEWAAWDGSLGVEPLSDDFTPASVHELSRRSRVAVKTWLMDQKRVVGVGNIYASEALFRAGIHPQKPALELTEAEAERLCGAVRDVLSEAIDFRGTTLLDYRDAQGERGGFAQRLRVYDRGGEPCRTCGAEIRRIVQGGRSTFFCEHCQA